MTGWCGWGLACRLRLTFEVDFRAAMCVGGRRLASGSLGLAPWPCVTSAARAVRLHHARTPRNVAAASLFFSTTFGICRRQAADGRSCASKRALLNNKSVSCVPPCGVSSLHCRMLTREGRRRHCSTHTRSSHRRQIYLQSRQKRRSG
jgi:hypothetical protein